MKKELITQLHHDFEIVAQREENIEFWYARDLQKLLGYNEWRNFLLVINKAKQACENSKHAIYDHFVDVNKMIPLGKGGQREVKDFANEITAFNTVRDDLRGEQTITQEHVKSNSIVRSALKQSNIHPENLPPAEDIKKVGRKIKSESKKLPKSTKVVNGRP
jgi:hypothetical protein